MRLLLIVCLLAACTGAGAESGRPPAPVVACDNLVTLRRLMMQAPEGEAIPAEFGGCREFPSDRIGDVEKRAMIGDAPYECRAVGEDACRWIRP